MHFYFLFILLSCCLAFRLPAATAEKSIFQNEFNHYSGEHIKEVAIMGSEASGTVFLLSIIKKNFPEYVIHAVSGHKFPHRHFFPWFDLSKFQIVKKKDINANHLEIEKNCLNDSKDCLFIYITKNAYDWLNLYYLERPSTYKNEEQSLKQECFSSWISAQWEVEQDSSDKFNTTNWNPYEGRAFNNILELRKYRILNFLQIGSLVNNFMFIRYEDLIKDPEEFVNFVSENFYLEKKSIFQEVSLVKLNWVRNVFHEKESCISQSDLDFITQHLDWEVEQLVGYQKDKTIHNVHATK